MNEVSKTIDKYLNKKLRRLAGTYKTVLIMAKSMGGRVEFTTAYRGVLFHNPKNGRYTFIGEGGMDTHFNSLYASIKIENIWEIPLNKASKVIFKRNARQY